MINNTRNLAKEIGTPDLNQDLLQDPNAFTAKDPAIKSTVESDSLPDLPPLITTPSESTSESSSETITLPSDGSPIEQKPPGGLFDNVLKGRPVDVVSGLKKPINKDLTSYQAAYGNNIITVSEDGSMDYTRARQQSGWQQAANAVGQTAVNTVLEVASQAGNVLDVPEYLQADEKVGNAFSDKMKELQGDVQEAMPIHREHPDKPLDFGDPAYWYQNGADIIKSAGAFAVVGMATGGAMGALGVGETLGTLTSAYILNNAEGTDIAVDTFKQAYAKDLKEMQADSNNFMTQEEMHDAALKSASVKAATARNINRATTVLNITGANMFMKAPTSINTLLKMPNKMNTLKHLGIEGAQEWVEEDWNTMSTDMAINPDYSMKDAQKFITSPEGLETGLMGAVGGIGQGGAGAISKSVPIRRNTIYNQEFAKAYNNPEYASLSQEEKVAKATNDAVKKTGSNKNRISDNDIARYRYNLQQEQLGEHTRMGDAQNINDVTSAMASMDTQIGIINQIQEADAAGEATKARALNNQLFDTQLYTAFDTGTIDSFTSIFEGYKNLSHEDAEKRGIYKPGDETTPDYYKTKAAERLDDIKVLSKAYLNSKKYINSDEVYQTKAQMRSADKGLDYIDAQRRSLLNDVSADVLRTPTITRKVSDYLDETSPTGYSEELLGTNFRKTPEYKDLMALNKATQDIEAAKDFLQDQYISVTSDEYQNKIKESLRESKKLQVAEDKAARQAALEAKQAAKKQAKTNKLKAKQSVQQVPVTPAATTTTVPPVTTTVPPVPPAGTTTTTSTTGNTTTAQPFVNPGVPNLAGISTGGVQHLKKAIEGATTKAQAIKEANSAITAINQLLKHPGIPAKDKADFTKALPEITAYRDAVQGIQVTPSMDVESAENVVDTALAVSENFALSEDDALEAQEAIAASPDLVDLVEHVSQAITEPGVTPDLAAFTRALEDKVGKEDVVKIFPLIREAHNRIHPEVATDATYEEVMMTPEEVDESINDGENVDVLTIPTDTYTDAKNNVEVDNAEIVHDVIDNNFLPLATVQMSYDYYNTTAANKLAYLAKLYKFNFIPTIEDGRVSIHLDKVDLDDMLNDTLDDRVLDPSFIKAGTSIEFEIQDTVLMEDGSVLHKDGFRIYPDGRTEQIPMNADNIPIAIKVNGEVVEGLYLHAVKWLNKRNLENTDEGIEADQEELRALRELIVAAHKTNTKVDSTILSRTPGVPILTGETKTVAEAFPELRIGVVNGNGQVETDNGVIIPTANKFLEEGRSVVIIPFGEGIDTAGNRIEGSLALNTGRNKLSDAHINSIAKAAEIYIADELTPEQEAIAKSIEDSYDIDIRTPQGLEKYIGRFVYFSGKRANNLFTFGSNLSAISEHGVPIMQFNISKDGKKGQIFYGLTGDNQDSKGEIRKGEILDSTNNVMPTEQVLEDFKEFLVNMYVNVNKAMLGTNTLIPIINDDNTVSHEHENYNDFIKANTTTKFNSITLKSGTKIYSIQGRIHFDMNSAMGSDVTAQQQPPQAEYVEAVAPPVDLGNGQTFDPNTIFDFSPIVEEEEDLLDGRTVAENEQLLAESDLIKGVPITTQTAFVNKIVNTILDTVKEITVVDADGNAITNPVYSTMSISAATDMAYADLKKILEVWEGQNRPDILENATKQVTALTESRKKVEEEVKRALSTKKGIKVTEYDLGDNSGQIVATSEEAKNEKAFDKPYTIDPLVGMPIKVRQMLEGVTEMRPVERNGVTTYIAKTNMLNLQSVVPASDVYNTLLTILGKSNQHYGYVSSSTPIITSFDTEDKKQSPRMAYALQRLQDNVEAKPYLLNVIETLKNSDPQVQQQFLNTMDVTHTNHTFVETSTKYDNFTETFLRTITPQAAANKNLTGLILSEWNIGLGNSDALTTTAEKTTLKPSTLNKFHSYFEQLANGKVTITPSSLNTWLGIIGVNIPAEAVNAWITHGIYNKGAKLPIEKHFIVANGIFFNINKAIKDFNPTMVDNPLTLEENSIFGDSSFSSLAYLISRYRNDLFNKNFRDGNGNTVNGFTETRHTLEQFFKLKADINRLRDLEADAFSAKSTWLNELVIRDADGITSINTDSNFFKSFDYFTAESLKTKGKLSKTIDKLTPAELEKYVFGLYQNKGVTKGTGETARPVIKVLHPTYSDKSSSIGFQILGDNYAFNSQGVMSENLKQQLVNILFAPEIDRIIKSQSNEAIGIKGYDEGAKTFLLFPALANEDSLFVGRKRDTEDKITDFGTLRTDIYEDAASKEVLKRLVEAHILEMVDDKLAKWQEYGIVKKHSDGVLELTYADKRAKKTLLRGPVSDVALSFVINTTVANMNMQQLMIGDIALFAKGRNFNDPIAFAESTRDNLGKRLAGDLAGKRQYAYTPGETFDILVLKDQSITSTKIDYIRQVLKAMYGEEKGEELAKNYVGITATDAQEYVSLKEHVTLLAKQAIISEAERDELIEHYETTKEVLPSLKTKVLQPTKPLYTNMFKRNGIMARLHVKSSTMPLVYEFTKGTELDKLRQILDSNQNNIARITYETAVKVGGPSVALSAWGEDGTITINPKEIKASTIQGVPREGHGEQQAVPYDSNAKDVNDGTQQAKEAFLNLMDVEGFVNPFTGNKVNGRKLAGIYTDLYHDLYKMKYKELLEELDYNPTYSTIGNLKVLRDIIEKEGIDRDYSRNDLDSLELTPDGTRFVVPMWLNNADSKIMSLLSSIVDNRVRKRKVHGKSLVLASSGGLQSISDVKKAGITTVPGWDGKLKTSYEEGGTVQSVEIFVPFKFWNHKGKKLKLSDFTNDEGFIDHTKLPAELLELYGYRIPTSGINLTTNLKIVGFLPENMGDFVIAPQDFITQMGSDFDVDKLFTHMYNTWYNEQTGELGKVTRKTRVATEEEKIQNDLLDIHRAILQNPAIEVQAARITPLSFGDLPGLAKRFYKGEAVLYPTPLSNSYQSFKYLSARSGKDMVGISALDTVFNAAIQHVSVPMHFQEIIDKKFVKVQYKIAGKLSNALNDSKSVVKKDGVEKFKSNVFEAFMASAVDNENEQLLHKLNIQTKTSDAIRAMAQLGFDEDHIITLINQPAVFDYLKKGKNYKGDTSFSDISKATIANIELSAWQDQIGLTMEAADATLQKASLALFLELSGRGSEIKTLQSAINSDSAGVGQNLFYSARKSDQIASLGGLTTITNATKLIGEYVEVTDQDMNQKAWLEAQGFIDYNGMMIKPTTIGGFAGVYASMLNARIWDSLYPYSSPAVGLLTATVLDGMVEAKTDINGEAKQRQDIITSYKSLVASGMYNFSGRYKDVQDARQRLMYDTTTHKSLGSIIIDLRAQNLIGEKADSGFNNPLLQRLQVGNTKEIVDITGAVPVDIKYLNAGIVEMDEAILINSIIDMVVNNKNIGMYNGEMLTTKKLIEMLLTHQILNGGVQKASQFLKLFSYKYLQQLGYYKGLEDIHFTNTSENVIKGKSEAFRTQYIQHNPEAYYDEGIEDLIDQEATTPMILAFKDAGPTQRVVVVKDPKSGAYNIYKSHNDKYIRIDLLGNKGNLEYDLSKPFAGISNIRANQVGMKFKSTTVSQAKPVSQLTNQVRPNTQAELGNILPVVSTDVFVDEVSGLKYYKDKIVPSPDTVFVFGSNPIGVNGNPAKRTGGAALVAQEQFGVKQGEKMNNKMSESGQAYGLTTVTGPGKRLSMTPAQITEGIKKLYETANANPNKNFKIAYTNGGVASLNGYTGYQMMEMFNQAGAVPANIVFSDAWVSSGMLKPSVPSIPPSTKKATFSYKGKTIDTEFTLSPDQELALQNLIDFTEGDKLSTMLEGEAGTGKTSIIGYLQKYLGRGHNFVYMAPTHAAAVELGTTTVKTGNTQLPYTVFSSMITDAKTNTATFAKKVKDQLDFGQGVIIIDETSMLNNEDVAFLESAADSNNVKLIFLGDRKQIPKPDAKNPTKKFIPAIFDQEGNTTLTQVHRQSDNNILGVLGRMRKVVGFQLFKTAENKENLKFLNRMDFNRGVVNDMQSVPEDTKVVSYTNSRVQYYNTSIRKALGKPNTATNGDIVIGYAGRNNKQVTKGHVANSVSYKIKSMEVENGKVKMTFTSKKLDELTDAGITGLPSTSRTTYLMLNNTDSLVLDEVTAEDYQNNNRLIASIFKDLHEANTNLAANKIHYTTYLKIVDDVNQQLIKYDLGGSYVYNPSTGVMEGYDALRHRGIRTTGQGSLLMEKGIDYGYAITVHKSQGLSIPNVHFDTAGLNPSQNPAIVDNEGKPVTTEKQAIAYVAMSRASKNLSVMDDEIELTPIEGPQVPAPATTEGPQWNKAFEPVVASEPIPTAEQTANFLTITPNVADPNAVKTFNARPITIAQKYHLDTQDMSIEDKYNHILSTIEATTDNPIIAYFTRGLRSILPVIHAVPIYVDNNIAGRGVMTSRNNMPASIRIATAKIKSETAMQEVLIEEIVHAALKAELANGNSQFTKDLNAIMEDMRSQVDQKVFNSMKAKADGARLPGAKNVTLTAAEGKLYPLYNIDEFVAGAIKSKDFQELLNGTEATHIDKSLWSKVVQSIKDLFVRLGIIADSNLEAVIDNTLRLFVKMNKELKQTLTTPKYVRTMDYLNDKFNLTDSLGNQVEKGNAQEIVNFINSNIANLTAEVKDNKVILTPNLLNGDGSYSFYQDDDVDPEVPGMIASVFTYKKALEQRIQQLKESIDKAAEIKDFKKIAEINTRLGKEIKRLEDLKYTISTRLLADKGAQDIQMVNDLLKGAMTAEEILYARGVVNFWENSKANLLSDAEFQDTKLVDVFGTIESRASTASNQLLQIEKEFVEDFIKNTVGIDANVDQVMNMFGGDINWAVQQGRAISEYDNILLSSIWRAVKEANQEAKRDGVRMLETNEEMIQEVLPIIRALNPADPWSTFMQETTDGKRTNRIVTAFTPAFYEDKKAIVRKMIKGQDGLSVGLFTGFLKRNCVNTQLTKIFPMGGPNAETQGHRDALKEEIGESVYNAWFANQDKKLRNYNNAREGHIQMLLGKYKLRGTAELLKHEAANNELQAFVHTNSPMYLEGLAFNNVAKKGVAYNAHKYYEAVPKAEKYLDSKYEVIAKEPALMKFYDHYQDTIKTLEHLVPESQKSSIQYGHLPTVEKGFIESWKDTRGIVSGAEGVWDSFMASMQTNYTEGANSVIDYATNKPRKTMNISVLKTHNKEINDYVEAKAAHKQIVDKEAPSKADKAVWKAEITDQIARRSSSDLGKVLNVFTAAALSYKHKSKIENTVKIAVNVLNSYQEQEMRPDGTPVKIQGVPYKKSTGESFVKTKESVDAFVDSTLYQVTKEEEGVSKTKKLYTKAEEKSKVEAEEALKQLEIDKDNGDIDPKDYAYFKKVLDERLASLGGAFVASKAGDNTIKYVQMKMMGWNLLGGITNMGIGTLSNFTEASGGQFFNTKDMMYAYRLATGSIAKNITFNQYSSEAAQKIRGMMDTLDVLKDSNWEVYNDTVGNKVSNKLKFLSPYNLSQRAEYLNQAPIMIAMARNAKVTLANGDKISIWDGFNNDGKWKTDEYGEAPAAAINKLNVKIDKVIARVHGNYDPISPIMAKRKLVGRLALQFRTFMLEGIFTRTERSKYDPNLEAWVKGRYRSVGTVFNATSKVDFAINTLKGLIRQMTFKTVFKDHDFTNLVNTTERLNEVVKNLPSTILRSNIMSILNDASLSTEERDSKVMEQLMSAPTSEADQVQAVLEVYRTGINDIDAINMKKVVAEVMQWITIMSMMALLSAVGSDDDDDDFFYNHAQNQLQKIATDLSFYASPGEAKNVISDILPILSLMDDVKGVGNALFDTMMGKGVVQSGTMAGSAKLPHAVAKMIPVVAKAEQLYRGGKTEFSKTKH